MEILCSNCDGHLGLFDDHFKMSSTNERYLLGHVFGNEGFRDAHGKPIRERHCVNSASLRFKKES